MYIFSVSLNGNETCLSGVKSIMLASKSTACIVLLARPTITVCVGFAFIVQTVLIKMRLGLPNKT